MSRREKLISRFLLCPKDFTWDELTNLLKYLGYREVKQGKTSGSRRRFLHNTAATITLHKPHPQNVLKRYVMNQLLELLIKEDLL